MLRQLFPAQQLALQIVQRDVSDSVPQGSSSNFLGFLKLLLLQLLN
jgi:hypothetical protein